MISRRTYNVCGLAVLLVLTLACRGSAKRSFTWWTASALVKVRPQDTSSSPQKGVALHAAMNEFESFQIALRDDSDVIPAVDVEVSDFAGPGGSVISNDNVTIYFERYLDLQRPSGVSGEAGEWPDPLIPKVDSYAHERRNAFPFVLPAGQTQPVWVEVYVPEKATPGHYTAHTTVRSGNAILAVIPVNLDVWGFALPSTSSLQTAFGFNGVTALKQHFGRYTNDDDLHAIARLYTKAALLHRVSAIGGPLIPPPFTLKDGAMTVDWTLYDADFGPFLNGTVLTRNDRLPGAEVTSVELQTNGSLDTDNKKILYWREWTRHFEKNGWLDRLFNYVSDEPTAAEMPAVSKRASLVHQADYRLRNLVTSPLKKALDGPIDIWTPLINCFETKPGMAEFCEPTVPRSTYDPELRHHKSLWWYQSCASHGCDHGGGAYFTGWPSYVIDSSAVSNRIMPWMSWKYRIDGELYYNTVEAFSHQSDPFQNLFLHGGNGDGTLFYPGRPREIGGKTQIPLESIRLKLIRDGLEDYEYFVLLAKTNPAAADHWVDELVQNTYTFDAQPEDLYRVRQEMGDEIERSLHGKGQLR